MSVRFRRFVQQYAEAGDYLVALVTFDSARLAHPVRLSSARETIVSQGRTFLGASLDYTLPSSVEQQTSSLQLVLPGISQQLIQLIDSHPERFDVTLEVVLRSTPNVIEVGPFQMRSERFEVDYSSGAASMECRYNYTLDMPLVTKKLTVSLVPGAFGAEGV